MNQNKQNEYKVRIMEQAVEWFALMQEPDHTPENRADFVQWLRASQLHMEEYLKTMSLWGDMVELGEHSTIDSLIDQARNEPDEERVVALFSPASTFEETLPEAAKDEAGGIGQRLTNKGKRKFIHYATAAAVLLAIFSITWFAPTNTTVVYETALGELASYTLEDGSTVVLNAYTRVEVSYGRKSRDIAMTRGEALFEVSKDPQRPFRVSANKAIIQAIGTRFNVRRRSSGVAVTVAEGVVEVKAEQHAQSQSEGGGNPGLVEYGKPILISTGEQAEIDGKTSQITVSNANLNAALAWQERWLVFDASPLVDIVEDFNRHNQVKMVLVDPDLGQLKVSGSFKAKNWQMFVKYLEAVKIARSTMDPSGRRILLQMPANSAVKVGAGKPVSRPDEGEH